MTRLGKAASKAFGLVALKIPWIGLGRIIGSKPWMVGRTWVPFWINPRNGSTTAGSANTWGVKPLMAGMAYPFFGASAFESTGDSIISSIMTKVEGAGGILHKCSFKYLPQSFLDPTIIALWVVPTWVFGGHRLTAMQLLLCMNFQCI